MVLLVAALVLLAAAELPRLAGRSAGQTGRTGSLMRRRPKRRNPHLHVVRDEDSDEFARSVERALAARQLLNPQPAEGSYRFQCTAEPVAFREVGVRFLQLPFGEVDLVQLSSSTMVAP